MHRPLSVRAVDVGYGHVKFTLGRDPKTGLLTTESFPSQSPASSKPAIESAVLSRRDTFIVPIGDRHYEVGKDIEMAFGVNHDGRVLDQNFATSDAYSARLFGALNYMAPELEDDVLDFLVLGLPMNTFQKHTSALKKQFVGDHVINSSGTKLRINRVEVFPQPLGSYAAYLAANPPTQGKPMPKALVVDPGYNTVDWFVVRGMQAADDMCGATVRGMGAVLTAIADKMSLPIAKGGLAEAQDCSQKELIRFIDRALISGEPLRLCGRPIDLAAYLPAGDAVIEEAAQPIKNSIGSGADLDALIMTGGGAALYSANIASKFPLHQVVTLDEPSFANVRGFHFLGEKLARSAERAATVAA